MQQGLLAITSCHHSPFSRVFVKPVNLVQMGKGLKAYVMTLGKQALEEDLVNIFDSAEITKIGTVEQQKSYHNEWLKSLG